MIAIKRTYPFMHAISLLIKSEMYIKNTVRYISLALNYLYLVPYRGTVYTYSFIAASFSCKWEHTTGTTLKNARSTEETDDEPFGGNYVSTFRRFVFSQTLQSCQSGGNGLMIIRFPGCVTTPLIWVFITSTSSGCYITRLALITLSLRCVLRNPRKR